MAGERTKRRAAAKAKTSGATWRRRRKAAAYCGRVRCEISAARLTAGRMRRGETAKLAALCANAATANAAGDDRRRQTARWRGTATAPLAAGGGRRAAATEPGTVSTVSMTAGDDGGRASTMSRQPTAGGGESRCPRRRRRRCRCEASAGRRRGGGGGREQWRRVSASPTASVVSGDGPRRRASVARLRPTTAGVDVDGCDDGDDGVADGPARLCGDDVSSTATVCAVTVATVRLVVARCVDGGRVARRCETRRRKRRRVSPAACVRRPGARVRWPGVGGGGWRCAGRPVRRATVVSGPVPGADDGDGVDADADAGRRLNAQMRTAAFKATAYSRAKIAALCER